MSVLPLFLMELDEDDYGSEEAATGWSIGSIILGFILIGLELYKIGSNQSDFTEMIIIMISGHIFILLGSFFLFNKLNL